jgi:multidrug resistance efflux pump
VGLVVVLLLIIGFLGWRWQYQQDQQHSWRQVTALFQAPPPSFAYRAGYVRSGDPELLSAPYRGTITSLVEDETWVEAGEVVLRLDDEEADTEVTQLLADQSTKRDEIDLLLQERDLATAEEGVKAENAARALAIDQARLRIAATKPQGGQRLITLDEQLLALEERLDPGRRMLAEAQKNYQHFQQEWLLAQDALLDARDAVMEAQLEADIAASRVDPDAAGSPSAVSSTDQVSGQPAGATPSLAVDPAELTVAVENATRIERAAYAAWQAAGKPLKDQQAAIAPLVAEEEELLILIEIEKKYLPALRLENELEQLALDAREAQRSYRDGQAAADAGALSTLRLQELADAVTAVEQRQRIAEARLALARAPTPVETMTALQAEVSQAEARLARAENKAAARLATLDAQIEVLRAELDKINFRMRELRQYYPRLIDAAEAHWRSELAAHPDNSDRRSQAEAALQALAIERAAVPPQAGAIKSPVAGVARLMRSMQVGTQVGAGDAVLRVFPATGLFIHVAVDEVTLASLSIGQDVSVTVPALADTGTMSLPGTVSALGGMGYDKVQDLPGRSIPTGIVLFPVRIALQEVPAGLRQGMSAQVSWQKPGAGTDVSDGTVLPAPVLVVPRAAARWSVEQGWEVRRPVASDGAGGRQPSDAFRWQPVEGTPLGLQHFHVASGLEAGDVVLIPGVL